MEKLIEIIKNYQSLNLDSVADFAKFNEYAITAHSTQIEGSTLTQADTSLLLDEGITPKGKPLTHTLMVTDHHKALLLVKSIAKSNQAITADTIQLINGAVMKSTGDIKNTALGTIDTSKGELRKGSVYVSARYFMSHEKVPGALNDLCYQINEGIKRASSLKEKITLCFAAHYELVTIHPFYDGNGRTSRLLMNLLQEKFDLPMSSIYKEDKLAYINALESTREKESMIPFDGFMISQYSKYLVEDIKLFNKQNKGKDDGFGLSFMF
ncbi:MAG: Fic family protein [Glaciecola sp.]|jgi:Fic family protein